MPGYLPTALTCFKHPIPTTPQDQPCPHIKPNNGAKTQHTAAEDTSPSLDKEGKRFFPRGLRDIPVLCARHPRQHPSRTLRPRVATGPTDGKHDETMQIVFGLHGISGRGCPHLQNKWSGPCRPQQCIVFIQNQGLQPRRGTHVHVSK